ncbi:MAG: phospholipase D-like domain-containing protein [Bacteroidales bacterium]|jgi:HKD family nuclease|nr:phospholipase D-like domain-containing protein [Bacteroidales bacterium]
METLQKNWSSVLGNLFISAKSELTISTPFLSDDGVEFLAKSISKDFKDKGFLRIITNLSPRNIQQRATNPFSFGRIYDTVNLVQLFHLPNLHAKVYIRDNKEAIITSGNLTAGGLYKNYEYGISVDDNEIVKNIKNDLTDYGNLGTLLDKSAIQLLCDKFSNIYNKNEFIKDSDVIDIEKDLLDIKLRNTKEKSVDKSINYILSKTIEYLLNKFGPLKVTEMHSYIQSIHPDLCGTEHRICNGRDYGLLWQHQVRTALVSLNRQNKIYHQDGRNGIWQLKN